MLSRVVMFGAVMMVGAMLVPPAVWASGSAAFGNIDVPGYSIANRADINRFYAERNGKFLWVDGDDVSTEASDIIDDMGDAWEQGLNPENYHYMALKSLQKNGIPEGRERESEILLSDGIIRFAQDLSGMRLSPSALGQDGNSWSRGVDAYSILTLLTQKTDSSGFLRQLAPQDDTYHAIVGEVRKLVADMAKHPGQQERRVSYPGLLKPGMRSAVIPHIRKRLGMSGNSDVYDKSLQEEVEDFQKLHGLTPDGIIGRRSFDAINQTQEQKLVKLIANLERRRWVRRPVPLKRVEVNIPEMRLRAYEDGQIAFDMPVIIGREKRPTMSFVDDIIGIRFNPSWYVPDTIKNEDFLPELQKDSGALNKKGIRFRVPAEEGGMKEVSSTDIDWSKMTPETLKTVQMFQGAGEDNALGTIRVLMPNRYDIYLHDTNAPQLFSKDDRALSSGCVRLSEPRRMANFVLGQNAGWADSKIDTYVSTKKLIEIRAENTVPVYLLYNTVWQDGRGRIVIANDVYGEDARLVQLLQKNGKIPFELSSGVAHSR